MIELGKFQKLKVARITGIGAYLTSLEHVDISESEAVLLPQKQIPEGIKIDDTVEVFVYKDSEDRLISTTRKPMITVGELALLKVVETTRIGAFLDWGLEKDLFLPFKEQTCSVEKGKEYLVTMYVDKSTRLAATMDIHKLLVSNSPYKIDDTAHGTIYKIDEEFGAFIAVDNKYHGLVPKHELFGKHKCGDVVEVRVTGIKEDGKLDLSFRPKAYKVIDSDAEIILERLEKRGVLYLNDNSSPEEIKQVLQMSKRAFKRAIGRLLKENKIRITDKGIEKQM